ncbi:unnamed protein product, partial [Ceratitis capitata]
GSGSSHEKFARNGVPQSIIDSMVKKFVQPTMDVLIANSRLEYGNMADVGG